MNGMMRRKLLLLHQANHPLAAHMEAFIMQLLVDAWAPIASFVLLIDAHNPFGNLAIFSLQGQREAA
jgi:hypothetical protein